jgi:hypothetical protein
MVLHQFGIGPSLHFTSLHFTSLHFTSLHFTSLHFTPLLAVLGVPGPASYHQKWLRVLEVLGVLGPASQAESVMD